MSIRGFVLRDSHGSCPYIAGNQTQNEQLIVESVGDEDLEQLFAAGYRHFGSYFFRPVCSACLPLRIPLAGYHFPRSARRILNRSSRFLVTVERPRPSREAYELYLRHKRRFDPPEAAAEQQTTRQESARQETYEEFVESFFHPFPFAYQLSVYDGERLIAVAHFDMTASAISAIYTYYDDEDYARESLGSLAIYKEIETGLKRGVDFVYLGYYVARNEHMNYKIRFRPNQVLREEGRWEELLDAEGNFPDNIEELGEITFTPKHRLQGGH